VSTTIKTKTCCDEVYAFAILSFKGHIREAIYKEIKVEDEQYNNVERKDTYEKNATYTVLSSF